MRRSAISIASNIAEGAARNHQKEFIQFSYISLASLSELDTQIEIASRIGIMTPQPEIEDKMRNLRMGLIGFIKHLKRTN